MNPWMTAYTTGFEVFTLNYDLLVGFGKDLEPVPGYAKSWERTDNGDGTFTWTFKLRDGMIWSDGEPATAEDARWTLQFVLDAVSAGEYVGLGYIDPDLTNAGVTKIEAPDATTLVLTNTDPSDRILQMYIPILPEARLGGPDPRDRSRRSRTTSAGRRQRSVPGGGVEDRPVRAVRPEPELLGPQGRRRGSGPPVLSPRPTRWSRPSRAATWTTRSGSTRTSSTASRPSRTSPS